MSSNRQYGFFAVLQPHGHLRFYYALPSNPGSIDTTRPYQSMVADAGLGYVNGSWRVNPTAGQASYGRRAVVECGSSPSGLILVTAAFCAHKRITTRDSAARRSTYRSRGSMTALLP